eukprot:3388044-Rhodomonas_salina.1
MTLWDIGLCACYAMPGTDLAYGGTRRSTAGPGSVLCACYAMSGTDTGGSAARYYEQRNKNLADAGERLRGGDPNTFPEVYQVCSALGDVRYSHSISSELPSRVLCDVRY